MPTAGVDALHGFHTRRYSYAVIHQAGLANCRTSVVVPRLQVDMLEG